MSIETKRYFFNPSVNITIKFTRFNILSIRVGFIGLTNRYRNIFMLLQKIKNNLLYESFPQICSHFLIYFSYQRAKYIVLQGVITMPLTCRKLSFITSFTTNCYLYKGVSKLTPKSFLVKR